MYQPNLEFSTKIEQDLRQIDQLLESFTSNHAAKVDRRSLNIDRAGYSVALDQLDVSPRQARALFAGDLTAVDQQSAIALRNYLRALDFVARRKLSGRALDVQDLFSVHKNVCSQLVSNRNLGKIRPDATSNERGYVGLAPERIDSETEGLFDWLEATDLHPVVAAAIFHYQLMAICPLQIGNGRTVRALTWMHLGVCGYDFDSLLDMDSYFGADAGAYYAAINSGVDCAERRSADLTPWVEYFTEGVRRSAEVLVTDRVAAIQA